MEFYGKSDVAPRFTRPAPRDTADADARGFSASRDLCSTDERDTSMFDLDFGYGFWTMFMR